MNPGLGVWRMGLAAHALCTLLTGALAHAASPAQGALDRGTELYKQGRYRDAAEAFKEATRLDPGLLPAWDNLGWAYHRAGQHREAIETWRTVLKVEPKRPELLNEIAAIQLGQGRWTEAAETLSGSLAIHSDQPKVRLRLAEAYEQSGRLREAEGHLREVVRLHPGEMTATFRLQEFLERHGRVDAALELLKEAQARFSPRGHLLQLRVARLSARRGDEAYRRRDYKAALADYQQAVSADPRNAQYLINLGWAHRQSGAPAEASAAWRKALALEPGHSALYRHIADAAFEQDDRLAAASMYSRAWAEADRKPSVPFRLAEIAIDEGRGDDAALWLNELFGLPDADAEWSRRVAGLFVRAEQPALGIDFFEKRLAASRQPAATRRALGRLHAAMGSMAYQAQDLQTAMRQLEDAVRLDATNPNALRDLGWVYWAADEWDACAKVWRSYAQTYPNETQPLNLLTHVALKRKDYAAAVDAARASLRLDPNQPEQRLKLAKALHWDGQFAEARSMAQALAGERPDDVAAQVFWGELLMQYHDFARGKPQWRRALDLGVRTPKAQFYWVKSMYELGDYDAALGEARRTIEQEGANQPLLQFLADDAMLRESTHQAIHWYALMTQHFPERLPAWIALARLQQQSGDLDAARRSLEEAGRRHPDRLDVALALAELGRRAGRVDEAYRAFASLSRGYPGNRDVFWGRIQTSLEAGHGDEALEVLRTGHKTFLKDYETRVQQARILFAMGREGEAQRSLAPVIDPPRGRVYVPILLYHGLGEHPRSPAMPVALFESQMRALREQGWTSVTLRELGRMAEGKQPYPQRPIVITFDDARIDSFELADPVLARHGMKATMFVPTARILDGHPFFADWDRIRAFAATGRWDLQSHGHHAHDLISVDAQQQLGSFLVNREWLEDEERLESHEEFVKRLDADYGQSIRELSGRFPQAELIAYAFPFSEAGQESVGNEPQAAETNQELLARYFRFGLIQDASGYNEMGPSAPGTMLRRFGVPRTFDGEALLAHLAEHHPAADALVQSARIFYWTARYDRARDAWERLSLEQPRMRGEAAYYLAAILYQQGRYDVAQQHLRAAESLHSERLQADPGLAQRIRWQSGGRLLPRLEATGDSDGRETLWQGVELRTGPLGPLETWFGLARLTLRQDGFESLEGHELLAGARVGPFDHWTFEGRGWQRRFDPLDSFSFNAGLAYENDWLALRGRGGREDLDTLGARTFGIQTDKLEGSVHLRVSPSVRLYGDYRYGRYEDLNRRRDWSARIVVQPRWGAGLGFGAAGGWSDTRFQSRLYYTPENVRWARALLSHQYRSGSGWLLETEMGLGIADDELRGRRRIAFLSGRAGQAWGDHMRTLFDARYGSSPGYESWGFGGSLQIRF